MDYFQIPAQDLGKNAKIPVYPLGDSGEVFYEMALEMVNTIKEHNARGEKTVFICPVGPVGQYPIFVRLVNRDRVSLKNCWFFNMDEYLNDDETYIDKESPLSFRGFMDRTVYTKVDPDLLMPPEQRVDVYKRQPRDVVNPRLQQVVQVDRGGIRTHQVFDGKGLQLRLSCHLRRFPGRVVHGGCHETGAKLLYFGPYRRKAVIVKKLRHGLHQNGLKLGGGHGCEVRFRPVSGQVHVGAADFLPFARNPHKFVLGVLAAAAVGYKVDNIRRPGCRQGIHRLDCDVGGVGYRLGNGCLHLSAGHVVGKGGCNGRLDARVGGVVGQGGRDSRRHRVRGRVAVQGAQVGFAGKGRLDCGPQLGHSRRV